MSVCIDIHDVCVCVCVCAVDDLVRDLVCCIYLLQVMGVVKEQVTRALDIQPGTFDQFRTKLGHLTYAEITNIWQQERRSKEESEAHAKPIQ